MPLHSTELLINTTAARLVSSLYNLGEDPTENTASNDPSIVVMGGCLATDWISFPRERVYRPLLRTVCLFVRLLHRNGCTRPFRGLCPATGLYATIWSFASKSSDKCSATEDRRCRPARYAWTQMWFLLISWGGVTLSPFGTLASIWSSIPAPDDRWWL
jgi:hypothetical protein